MSFIKLGKTKERDIDDNELVRRIVQNGEKELLEDLYERYANLIFHKCISLTHDRDLSKDLTHDIMVKVLTNLSKFKGNSRFSLWVHAITYNFCMDYFRKQKKLPTVSFDAIEYQESASDNTELALKKLKEMRIEQLEHLFTKLRPDEKAILLMRYQDGLSIKEIAEALEKKEGAIKMRLKRSREKLSNLIKSDADGN